jgi:MFS family permease
MGGARLRQGHDPFATLRVPSFRLFSFGRFVSAIASTVFAATVFWQVFEISDSEGQLALVGLVQFIPSLGFGLVGGVVADRYNKKLLGGGAQAIALVGFGSLAGLTWSGEVGLPAIYAAAFLISTAAAFEAPARGAILPAVIPRDLFSQSVTISSTFQQLGFVTGPALSGLLIWLEGPGLAYAVAGGLMAASVLTWLFLRLLPVVLPKRAVSVQALAEGIQFVRRRQVILGAMTLDMFAVIFGGAVALLPVYAEEVLDVGALGYGMLAASLDLGALLMSVGLVLLPPIRRMGRALLIAVFLYGIGVVVFGASSWFPLSLCAYAFIGMADQVSVVCRQTMVQLATPDALRGRVTSVNMLFIGASNRLGAVESGSVAHFLGPVFAVVSGGVGCIGVVGLVAWLMPALRRWETGDAVHDDEPGSGQSTQQGSVASAG